MLFQRCHEEKLLMSSSTSNARHTWSTGIYFDSLGSCGCGPNNHFDVSSSVTDIFVALYFFFLIVVCYLSVRILVVVIELMCNFYDLFCN